MADKLKKQDNDLICERTVYSLLFDVFSKKAYSSVILDKTLKSLPVEQKDKDYITKVFYGVLDKSLQFDYIISSLCKTEPKTAIKIILKIGFYLLRYMSTPVYAAVNKTVELAKVLGKGGASGFVNAVLKKSVDFSLPAITDNKSLSIVSSSPLWLVEELIEDYGFDFTCSLLRFDVSPLTHIRINLFKITKPDFEKKYPFLLCNSSKYGYYVTHNTILKLEKVDYIIQSYSSIAASNYYFEESSRKILDLCAAPGGKSVLLKELYYKNGIEANITACDVHPHRVELIKKYAASAGCSFEIMQNDATVFKSEWAGAFDLVICDVPCSGIGVAGSKPEILLNRKQEDIEPLTQLQLNILQTASKYVKTGGFLCYSTCTVLKKENREVVDKFLKNNLDFAITADSKELNLFPHIDNCDGFYAVKLIKGR